MDLKTISLLLAVLALAHCDDIDNEELLDIIGSDSDELNESVQESVSQAVQNQYQLRENAISGRRFLNPFPTQTNCPCFPGKPNAIPVSHYLQPTPGTNYERLVVYLYQNKGTNDVKIYIPNRERQNVFPDVTYENGDVLNPINPNLIDSISDNLGPAVHPWLPVLHNPIHEPNNLDIFSKLSKPQLNSILLYLQRHNDTKDILDTLNGVTIEQKLLQLKRLHPKIYSDFVTKIDKVFPLWLNQGNIATYNPGHLINFPYDVKLIPALNQNPIAINGKPHNIKEIIVYKPHNTDVSTLYPDNNGDVTFENWLNIFINRLNNQLKFISNAINPIALKSLVVQILHQNGLSISPNGLLIDVAGNAIPLANLLLQPIIIGESNKVKNLINNGLFKIAPDDLFVEVLLLSGGQSRSLGIIPIEELLVGAQNYDVNTVVQAVETIVACDGGQCRTEKKCKDLNSGRVIPCQNLESSGTNVINLPPGLNGILPIKRTEPSGTVYNIKCNKNQPCPFLNGVLNGGNLTPPPVSPDILGLLNHRPIYVEGGLSTNALSQLPPVVVPQSGSNHVHLDLMNLGLSGHPYSVPLPKNEYGRRSSIVNPNVLSILRTGDQNSRALPPDDENRSISGIIGLQPRVVTLLRSEANPLSRMTIPEHSVYRSPAGANHFPVVKLVGQGRIPPIHIPTDDVRTGAPNPVIYVTRKSLDEPPKRLIPGVVPPRNKPIVSVSEEVPGIRIVGGGPATSSGTPVNSKGRSGAPDISSEEEE